VEWGIPPLGFSISNLIKEFKMAIDPVCKMTVDEKKAAATSDYNGNKYFFCAKGCKIAFDKAPEKYLAKKG
jgi:YHS domain-containing protein